MMDNVLSFITSQSAGIFALLFLNNILMYLVAKRHFGKVWVEQEQRYKDVLSLAGRHEQALRAVIYAFEDEDAGLQMPSTGKNLETDF